MTREQAVKRLQKLYGRRMYYRVGNEITSPEKRAAALERLRAARAAREANEEKIKTWLAAQPEYQAMRAERREINLTIDRAQGEVSHYKFWVGKSVGFANEITGQGDTWEEAIAEAESKKGK